MSARAVNPRSVGDRDTDDRARGAVARLITRLSASLVLVMSLSTSWSSALAAPDGALRALPSERAQRLPDGTLFVPKSAQRGLELRTAIAEAGIFPGVLELAGRVIADPGSGGRVQSALSGRIEALSGGFPLVGQAVRRGQPLARLQPVLNAIERGAQRSTLVDLAAQASILERQLARLEQLDGIVPRKEVERARIELEAIRERLRALTGSVRADTMVSPVDGVISAVHVQPGQLVDARALAFEVIDPSRLAVDALSYQALPARGIDRAGVALADGGRLELHFVGAGGMLKDQAIPVLFRVAPAARGAPAAVSVGQSVRIIAQTRDQRDGVAVPAQALVRDATNETVVWLHDHAERFSPVRVRAEPLDVGRVLVRAGLKGGERVVTRGAVALSQVR